MLLEDKALVEKCLTGDDDAFGKLVEKYQSKVHCIAFSILGNFHDAEEVAQETFLKAYISLRKLSNLTKFSFWLCKIARNVSYDWRKRESKQIASLSDLSLEDVNQMSLQRHRAEELSVEIMEALDSLSEKQRTPLIFSLAGYSYQEISEFLKAPQSTIRGRIARAKQSLRKEILDDLNYQVNAHKLDKQFAQGVMSMIRQLPERLKPSQPKSNPNLSRIIPVAIIGLLAITAIILRMLYSGPEQEDTQMAKSELTHGWTNNYEWTRTLISSWTSAGNRVIYNPNDGHIYTVGFFADTVDFDPTDGTDNNISAGWTDWYVWKLNSSGLYGSDGWYLTDGNSAGHDIIYDIVFDGNNNFYIVGSEDISVTDPSILIAKYNESGQKQWSYVFGNGKSYATAIALSSDNKSIFVIGCFRESVDFDPYFRCYMDVHTAVDSWDAFVMKLSEDGDYLWTKPFGGFNEVLSKNIAVDINDNIYISGEFVGTVDFDPEPGEDYHTSNGFRDVFVVKLNSDGSYAWAKTFGGTGHDISGYRDNNSMSVTEDRIYLVGSFRNEVDFDPGFGVDMRTSRGSYDAYILSLDLNGNCNWVKTFGSIKRTRCNAITRWKDEIYITGEFNGTVDFDPGPEVDEHTSSGTTWGDMFISKYDGNNNYLWTETVGSPTGFVMGHSIAVDDYGGIYITGYFNHTIDFDSGTDADIKTAQSADASMFLTKFTQR
ncbi:sigma-70 family RNA polymerase sigma factor [bacterium]|nr:sigma-70 family RNA polymerase sigma factor [bacterium]